MEQECKICFHSLPNDSFVKLTCGHSFCKNCLIEDWTSKIKENQVDGTLLKCPDQYCNVAINFYLLKLYLPKETFEKYEKCLLENMEPVEVNKEKTINCPKCDILVVIWKDADYFDCAQCKQRFCAQNDCRGNWDEHKNISCEKYKEKFANKHFEKYLQENNIKKCPICHINIEKIRNCNVICCESGKCQKKTTFCYLCGKLLKKDEIASHFLNGEYGKQCVCLAKPKPKTWREFLIKYNKYKIEILCSLCPYCWFYLPCWIWRREIFDNGNKILNRIINRKKN